MDKIIKYEFKTIVKDLIILLGIILALNILILAKVSEPNVSIGLSVLVFMIGNIALIIMSISQMNRDLYGDTGYLVFSIPQSGYSILGGKILNMLIQMLIINLIGCTFMWYFMYKQGEILHILTHNLNYGSLATVGIMTVFQYVSLIVTIFFCITLSRVGIKNKKIGKLGAFGVFIVLMIVISKITDLLVKLFPQQVSINLINNLSFTSANSSVSVTSYPVNIATGIFDIIFFIAMFIITSKLLENRIEL